MGFQLPGGYEAQLPQAPGAQRVAETGGDVAKVRARERTGELIGGAFDLAGEIYSWKVEQQIGKAQTAYRRKMSELEMQLQTQPLSSPGSSEAEATAEEEAMPNYYAFRRRREEILTEINDEYLDIWGSQEPFERWRRQYDLPIEQRIRHIDVANAVKGRMDSFTETVEGIVASTTAENVEQQRRDLVSEVFAAVESGLIDSTDGDDMLDAAYQDVSEKAIRARLDAALAAQDFSGAEAILGDPDTWSYTTYDGKEAYIREEVRGAFRDYVAGERAQHLRRIDEAEAELSDAQYRQIIQDFDRYGPEKLRYLMEDTGRYATFFTRNPQQMERWYGRLQAMEAAEAKAREAQQRKAAEREPSEEELREQRIERIKKSIERKIEAGVDHDEVDRVIGEAGRAGWLDAAEMSTYYRRNESRNPDAVREWMYRQIEETRASEEEKARMTVMLQRELARINVQEGAANLSMDDAGTMVRNITDPVRSAEIRELIDNRMVRRSGAYAKGRSVWAAAGELTEGQVEEEPTTLTAREEETQRLYGERSLYGTTDPQLISALAFEENLGDPETIMRMVDPHYQERTKRDQRILRANVRAGIIARDHLRQFVDKWGSERITNTYISALGTLVIETDSGFRWRRYTPPDSMDSVWQFKKKSPSGQWSEIWQTYEWGE